MNKTISKTLLTLLAIIILVTNTNTTFANNGDDDFVYVKKNKCSQQKSFKKSTSNMKTDIAAPTNESWLTPGTQEYEVAKKVFNYLTQVKGTSGAFASSVLGAISKEASFIEDRAEGPGICRFGMNSKTAPSCAIKSSNGTGASGGGIYQITPWQNFVNSQYWQKIEPQGWGALNTTEYIWAKNFKNRYAQTRINWAKNYYKGFTDTTLKTTEDLVSTQNVEEGTKAYAYLVLRGANWAFDGGRSNTGQYYQGTMSSRIYNSTRANEVFNKDNIQADPTKWDFAKENNETKTPSIKTKQKPIQEKCVEENTNTTNANWGQDYTGSRNNITGSWTSQNLPPELKKYAINPQILGIGQSNCDGWNIQSNISFNLKGQCVYLSKNLFPKIWTNNANTTENIMQPILCNGIECAENFRKAYEPNSKLSTTPSKGAVASSLSTSIYGHTYIVSHVFEDKSILIVEQNTSLSGASKRPAPTQCDYNYRIILEKEYTNAKTKFFAPSKQSQYKPNPKLTNNH